jgi:LL-diaminopimelate aminotransferase
MRIRPSKRLELLQSAIFTEMSQLKKRVETEGLSVIDLGIGSPDQPPSDAVIESLRQAVSDKANYGYPTSEGLPAFRTEVADWYRFRFNVRLDSASEVLSLMGSQDGLAHLAQSVIDPGDIVLVPDPGYPIYAASVIIAGGELVTLPLKEQNHYLPDLDAIPEEIARKAKLMILNYPSNPLSAVADLEFFERVVAFAKKHEIIVAHDLAYSEMAFDGYDPPSFLQAQGAKEVGIEFNSLSKSFNMAGCRIAYVVGNAEVIRALSVIKSNIDYGVFLAIQKAAIEALRQDRLNGKHLESKVSNIYERRRDIFVDRLNEIGWAIEKPKATMFIWARVPSGWTSLEFAKMLLEQAGVLVIPGHAFGKEGEGYVRMALVHDESSLIEVVQRFEKLNLFYA